VGLKEKIATVEGGDSSAKIKSTNPVTDSSVATQTLPELVMPVSKASQISMGQFALYFCQVGHCTRTKNSPWEEELEASLTGGYRPVGSEL